MDYDIYLRFVAALAFVLALIWLIAWVMRRYGFGRSLAAAAAGKRRLGIVEVAPLDRQRRLVLLRRDDREHLVLLGPSSDTLIETDITPATADNDADDETVEEPARS